MLALTLLTEPSGRPEGHLLRIRLIQRPPPHDVDGIRLDQFEPGREYELGNTLGALFLAEGWAEPVAFEEPVMEIPMRESTADARKSTKPSNLMREILPPYFNAPKSADRRIRRRARQHLNLVASNRARPKILKRPTK